MTLRTAGDFYEKTMDENHKLPENKLFNAMCATKMEKNDQ